jgi:carbon-monoxide dehydrogenase large subunit
VSQVVGRPVPRVEDLRLLTGRGRYVADLRLGGMQQVAFVRSPYPHARIRSIRVPDGRVYQAADLQGVRPIAPRWEGEGFLPTAQPPLAEGVVRYVGEPVAAVVAPTRYAAEDLAEQVQVDYEPLPPVPDVDAALSPEAQRLHPDNVLYRRSHVHGDPDGAFRHAEVVVRTEIRSSRCTAAPLEGRGVTAWHDGSTLWVWTNTQTPSLIRSALAHSLGLPDSEVRVVVPDTGGGFGQKMHLYPEEIVVSWLALRLGVPVQWVEDRRENLTASAQAREERVEVELAAGADGRILGLRARVLGDVGAYHVYPTTAALEPLGVAQILPGPYDIPHYAYEVLAVATNKPPTGAYRGVGMTVGVLAMERAVDLLAARLRLDPVEVRRRNLVPEGRFPYTSASGLVYDGGSFREALERVCALADYEHLRREQEEARRRGKLLGIGLTCYVEYTGLGSMTFRRRGMTEVPGHEGAWVRVEPDGTVRVFVSFSHQGQGHETTLAQLVAETLHRPVERIRVERVDTAASPHGSGTFASRSSVAGVGAVLAAAERVRGRAQTIAAALLEAAPEDVVWEEGRLFVRGAPHRSVTFEAVAAAAYRVPPGGSVSPGLEAVAYFDPPPATFSNAAHLAVVEVDSRTGTVRIRGYFVAEDCGRIINPLIVRGQLYGGIAQGIGEALLEHAAYDDHGQPLATTFMDYLIPTVWEMPEDVRVVHLQHPSDRPGGFKGMAEGGTIAAPAAVANAVADAVGAPVTRLPLTPEAVLELLRQGSRDGVDRTTAPA